MLQWFISFPEFAEFTEILFYLGKTQFRREFALHAITRRILYAIQFMFHNFTNSFIHQQQE